MSQQYANSALCGSRPASTLALQVLRDKQKKLELAARMYRLWEESGHTQEAVAEAIGLKHRSYQKALQTGGIGYERLRKLAEFHGVNFDWLLNGERQAGETPDLTAALSDPIRAQLDRIEQNQRLILEFFNITADTHGRPELTYRDAYATILQEPATPVETATPTSTPREAS